MRIRRSSRRKPVGLASTWERRQLAEQSRQASLLDHAARIWWRSVLLIAIIGALLAMSALSLLSCRSSRVTTERTDTLRRVEGVSVRQSTANRNMRLVTNIDPYYTHCLVDNLIKFKTAVPFGGNSPASTVADSVRPPFYYLDVSIEDADTSRAIARQESDTQTKSKQKWSVPIYAWLFPVGVAVVVYSLVWLIILILLRRK